ncbi:hypothetical protein ACFZCP_14310 [Streptomyces sp. NPDC007971]|uniref:hypothetical protein n=1 Tax=Streptomyces sp. NPDC007971 TaxID=3364799 RepID=UPI0036EEF626
MAKSKKDEDGTERLQAALKALGIDSNISYTGGGCWVVNVHLNNDWRICASRPDGPEYGYYYGIEHEKAGGNPQGGWGPGIGPKKAAKRIRALMRGLGQIEQPN